MLGTHLTVMMGPTVAAPVPPFVLEALESAEVEHGDEGRSGFQLTFQVGRTGQGDALETALLASSLVKPFNRVVLVMTVNLMPSVLMDGVITNIQFSPSDQPGESRLTLTGEDLSVLMDLEDKRVEHPAQDETLIAFKLIGSYAHHGLIPLVTPPLVIDPPLPIERTPVQTETDLAFLQRLAARHGYVFYLSPGPAPMTSVAWWGPPKRFDVPQPALSVNMGMATNVSSIQFQYNALAQSTYSGQVRDRQLHQTLPFQTFAPLRLPPMAALPAVVAQFPHVRQQRMEDVAGLTYTQALARAQGRTDASADQVLTATGELDVTRYGTLLQPRGVVGVRGAGYLHDGLYYVKRVSHSIKRGDYTQRFTLTREGYGSTTPVVRP
ncbi:hypothetical protein [Pyxidicoccus xibeiensis]|uniref:hypothetical protein n=1 Tax=Pyxidicoccus xibeiensis TaxID=2906759 RepID=UPI0020A727B4|nr:hypothetical protein [Pyxidicoccus xibeiensis]MCP3137407.1 hypothetical protein [Pyxidicoccus xibeiensis]